MDKHQASGYYETSTEELFEGRKRLQLISKALKDYVCTGKTPAEFEAEFGCDIILDEYGHGIIDIKFHNSCNETMFMLKYNNDI